MKKARLINWGLWFFILFLAISTQKTYGQVLLGDKSDNKDKKSRQPWQEKFFIGGSIGFTFGSYTYVNVSPIAGYRFTPRWTLGVGGTFQYYRTNSSLFNDTESIIYGGNSFLRFVLIPDLSELIKPMNFDGAIYLHGEYEALSLETSVFDAENTSKGNRFWLNSVLVGGGVRQQVGRRAYIFIELLWNLNYDNQLPYENPLLRIGFSF